MFNIVSPVSKKGGDVKYNPLTILQYRRHHRDLNPGRRREGLTSIPSLVAPQRIFLQVSRQGKAFTETSSAWNEYEDYGSYPRQLSPDGGAGKAGLPENSLTCFRVMT